jgi:hypothetical protein
METKADDKQKLIQLLQITKELIEKQTIEPAKFYGGRL